MMRKFAGIVFVLSLALGLSACLAPKSYVDTTYAKTRYEDLQRPPMMMPLKVNIEFMRNGKRFTRGDNDVRVQAERVLRASGLVTPSAAAAGEMTITLNNVGDLGDAAASGFGTGLTFGLVGSLVTDGYEMTVTMTVNGRTVTKTGYKHAIHSTIGNRSGPPGLTPTTVTAAFSTVVEQMLLNALGDLQKEGYLGTGTVAAKSSNVCPRILGPVQAACS